MTYHLPIDFVISSVKHCMNLDIRPRSYLLDNKTQSRTLEGQHESWQYYSTLTIIALNIFVTGANEEQIQTSHCLMRSVSFFCFFFFFLSAPASVAKSRARPIDDQTRVDRQTLIMKYFLLWLSPFRWFKKGSCQFPAHDCAKVQVKACLEKMVTCRYICICKLPGSTGLIELTGKLISNPHVTAGTSHLKIFIYGSGSRDYHWPM